MQLDRTEGLSVDRDRHAALEADADVLGLVGRLLGPRHELEDVVGWRLGEVLDRAPLRGAAPDVVVDRVRRGLGPALDGDPVLAGVGDLLLAAHPPLAHRSDHLELGVERRDRRLDADLVVALARAAVGDRVAARGAGVLDGELRDQRATERGEERVAAAVEGVGLDRRVHVLAHELLAGVDQDRVAGAEVAGLAGDHVPVLVGLAEVHGHRDDLGVVALLDPAQHHRGVEAARVEEQHPADLAGGGEVGRDRLVLGVGWTHAGGNSTVLPSHVPSPSSR